MRWALLGIDDPSRSLSQALIERGHTLVLAAQIPTREQSALRALAPTVELSDEWESLVNAEQFDVALVAADRLDDVRLETLRKLLQTGVPMVVVHPAVDAMIAAFELEMIRKDTHSLLLPWLPGRLSSASQQVRAWVQQGDGPLGRIEQIVCERSLLDRSATTVRRVLANDLDWLRYGCGDLTKVAAMTAATKQIDFANLSVQLSGPAGVVARWSVLPSGAEALRVTLIGSAGRAVLVEHASGAATLAINDAAPQAFRPPDYTTELLTQVQRRLAGQAVGPEWLDAVRALELLDGVERSAHKGRTIELHLDEVDEESTFKGMMAASGCLLLLLALFVVIVATTATHLEIPLADYWPYGLLALLGGFTLLQSLKLAFPPKGR